MKEGLRDPNHDEILKHIKNLERRIAHIESHLNLMPSLQEEEAKLEVAAVQAEAGASEELEFTIGQFWFAKLGIVALALGIALLLTFPFQNLPPALPSLFGYICVLGLFALSYWLRQSFLLISRYLFGGGLLLLFFTTLRLHFFTDHPVIKTPLLVVILLLFVTTFNLIISIRRRSIYLAGYSLAMGYLTGLIGSQPLFLFLLLIVLSTLAVYLRLKFNWNSLLNLAIFLTYFTHLLWFINNPILGRNLELMSSPEYNLYFLLIDLLVFAGGILLRQKSLTEDASVISSSFLNCFGGYLLFLFITLTRFQEALSYYQFFAALVFIALSIFFWMREKSRYSTFFYAMTGYTALSVAIIAQFPKPDFFVWLCWQSLLVISTAILFRSKFIVLANFIIFLILFFANLFVSGAASLINLSFGAVALLSARIMNWQKDRLELKTELMRNAYLTTAFFIFPFTLFQTLPGNYVGLSWIGVALFYYIMSIGLSNKKYRWMGHLTLVLAVLYIAILSIVKLEPMYRLASFLVLGIVLLAISLVYTRMRDKMKSQDT